MSRSERWTERFAVAAIVLAFAAIATTWAFIVPIFQSPDEPHHFDYAYQIASRGRLIFAREGPPRDSPAVSALESMLGTDGMIFHPSRHVDPLYGTPSYVSALSRIAARDARPLSDRTVPFLVATYPFGFYALVGFGIRPFVASPVEALFAARLICIAIVSCGLCILYLLARENGIGRARATILLLLCAGLPLSAFVGSYVQPDDLAFTLGMAALYIAARVRRRPASVSGYVAFSVALALMVAVKPHVALAIAVVALPLFAVRLAAAGLRWFAVAGVLGAIVIPAAAMAFATTSLMVGGKVGGYYDGSLVSNLAAAPKYVTIAISEYFNYPIGITANSYWGIYGWLDAPMDLRPPFIAAIVHPGLRVGTWLMVFAVVWLVVRNLRRLVHLARRRSLSSAWRVGTGDVLINAYLVFALIMIALYAASANAFGAQGRNWFPFVGAAMATAFMYAPKVLPRGAPRRIAGRTVVAFLAVYVVFGSWSAIRSVEARYYSPNDERTIMAADRYELRPFRGAGSIDRVVLAPSDTGYTARISGWIVDPHNVPPAGVIVTYGSRDLADAKMHVDRRDIPARNRNPRYPAIGFSASATIPRPLWRGARPIRLVVVTPDDLYAERYPWHAPEGVAP